MMSIDASTESDARFLVLELEIERLRKDIEVLRQLRSDVEQIKLDTRSLAAAWNTATGLVSFVKWLAALVAAGILIREALFKYLGW